MVDPTVVPGLLLLVLELLALAAVGCVVARVALRQTDDLSALAQGLVIGPALWGLIVNFVMYLLPGVSGAGAAWAVVLALAVGLAWRAPSALRFSPRTVAGFAAAALALFWATLAARQTLLIPDVETHLGLAASIRAGGFPPALPWIPGHPASYHYGVDMLVGLLTPPVGPDLAFVTELLSAYIWTSFAFVAAAALRRRAAWPIVLALIPLLLTAGGWTLAFREPTAPVIVQVLAPSGVLVAGIRASLADIYWPFVEWPWATEIVVAPPNIWKPFFVLAYALAVVILERLTASRGRSWAARLTLASLLGFLGLADETVALMTLALWVLVDAFHFRRVWRGRASGWRPIWLAAAGPALAALLLAVGGGVITHTLVGASASGLSLGWIDDAGSRRPFGAFDVRPGGVGLLGLGPLALAAVAGVLAWRSRLVLALVIGSGAFLLAGFVLQYDVVPHDVYRFDGHARTFALLAFLLALSGALSGLRRRWRYVAVATIVVVIVWPTIARPARTVALALDRGIHVSNARPEQREFDGWLLGRYALPHLSSERVVDYIRDHTPVDARVLSPVPKAIAIDTGRPVATGFAELLHLRPKLGSEYTDAIHYLEPAAVQRLGFAYVHATDVWVAGLPERAQRWLADPELFDLRIRDGADALYRIQPAFLELSIAPAAESFEALRQAVEPGAAVYLSPALEPLSTLRAAATLTHARLFGVVDPEPWHLLTPIPIEPLEDHVPDLVLTAARLAPAMFPPERRTPIWWNKEIAVYATSGPGAPGMPQPRDFSVRVSDAQVEAGRLRFTAAFTDRAPDRWKGQDWIVAPTDRSAWALPAGFEADERTYAGVQWYAGQVVPGQTDMTHHYVFDPRAASLAVRGQNGDFAAAASSGDELAPGAWILAVRLRGDWWETAFIPLTKIEVTSTGEVRYTVFDGPLDGMLIP